MCGYTNIACDRGSGAPEPLLARDTSAAVEALLAGAKECNQENVYLSNYHLSSDNSQSQIKRFFSIARKYVFLSRRSDVKNVISEFDSIFRFTF